MVHSNSENLTEDRKETQKVFMNFLKIQNNSDRLTNVTHIQLGYFSTIESVQQSQIYVCIVYCVILC